MNTTSEVKAWAQKRLESHRIDLEALGTKGRKSEALRGRIAELKELQAALENATPPVWNDAS